MSSSAFSPDAAVKARFRVRDSYRLQDERTEYSIQYGPDSKQGFLALLGDLSSHGYSAQLRGSKEECTLTVARKEPRQRKTSRFPVIFALLTFVSAVVFSLLQQTLYESLAPGIPGYLIFVGFCLAIAIVLACHELGRRFMGRRNGTSTATQYLVPGVPFLPPFLPATGFAGVQRWAAANRDRLFDVVVAGPIAIVFISVAFFIVGELNAFQSSVTLAASNLGNSTVFVNSNAIQVGIGALLGSSAVAPAPGYVMLSPLEDVATLGFILAFISLLPMAIFDGGHLAALVFGQKMQRVATYLSVLLLLALDTPNYWAIAVVVLVLAGRLPRLQLLDEVSDLSQSKQTAYAIVLIVAALCIPLPGNFATLPL